ncbi:hypothetical protein sS8_2272 [Methylocaldum marinum]|uniref:Uncharacterized protein n=1 Tax=Methylocaldum marinum TaxID=1432792 RepID=A0A250KRT2_9GAMM|nr:hypothetical protein sS8_2272 [Methylocaldum marinum]
MCEKSHEQPEGEPAGARTSERGLDRWDRKMTTDRGVGRESFADESRTVASHTPS